MMARYGQGVALQDRINCPPVQTSHHGSVPAMRTAAVFNEQDGSLNVFIVNFDGEEDTKVKMDFRAFGDVQMIEHAVISGELAAANPAKRTDILEPVRRKVQQGAGGMVDVVIPGSSWNMLRFSTGAEGR
jgi:alpha-N-arabinofuranosidase